MLKWTNWHLLCIAHIYRLCIANYIRIVDTGHLDFQKWLVVQQCWMNGNNGWWLSLKANVTQNNCFSTFIHTHAFFYRSVLLRCCSAAIENYPHHFCKLLFQRHLLNPVLAYFHFYFLQQYKQAKSEISSHAHFASLENHFVVSTSSYFPMLIFFHYYLDLI